MVALTLLGLLVLVLAAFTGGVVFALVVTWRELVRRLM